MRFILFSIFSAVLFSLGAASTFAATLTLTPKGQSFAIGQEFTADLVINPENATINAAQATINFPSSVLQAVSVDRSKSVFNFWVEDPTIANGKITFIGGTSENIAGNSLLIFTVRFKTIGAGRADISISDGIVTASDGKGTNVLSTVRGASITVSTTVASPASIPQEQPAPVVREAVPTTKFPLIPNVKVGLYPDQSKWYKHAGDVIALWDVPTDVTQVAAVINQTPIFIPTTFDKELFNGKNFGVFKEGIWYLHVRFKNNVGNGPAVHYKIAIDLTPPIPFRIETSDGLRIEGLKDKLRTDNPQPFLAFEANDALSGINKYIIQIGDQENIEIVKGELKLPLQAPGTRMVLIKAVDNAGNTQEKSLELEIIPIASPVITFINKNIFANEGEILIRGTAEVDLVKILLKKETGDVVAAAEASADKQGNWETIIEQPLRKGSYFFEVVAQDQRGALSLPVKSELFKVREKPLFSISGFGITQFWFFISIIILLLGGFGVGLLSHHFWKAQLSRKTIVAQRDVVSSFDFIGKDVDKAISSYSDKRISKEEASEMAFLLKKAKDNLGKMQKYIVENIDEIRK